jgi:small GTP-binding protein
VTESKESLTRYKVSIVGDGGVGKTTLLRRYTTGKFQESRVMTIGVDFQTITVKLKDLEIKLTVWDLGGQERFASFRDGFYRGSRAVALVYDVTDMHSFQGLPRWLEETGGVVPDARLILDGNKIDLPRVVPKQLARDYAREIGAIYVETSCLTGEGVYDFFTALAAAAHVSSRKKTP